MSKVTKSDARPRYSNVPQQATISERTPNDIQAWNTADIPRHTSPAATPGGGVLGGERVPAKNAPGGGVCGETASCISSRSPFGIPHGSGSSAVAVCAGGDGVLGGGGGADAATPAAISDTSFAPRNIWHDVCGGEGICGGGGGGGGGSGSSVGGCGTSLTGSLLAKKSSAKKSKPASPSRSARSDSPVSLYMVG